MRKQQFTRYDPAESERECTMAKKRRHPAPQVSAGQTPSVSAPSSAHRQGLQFLAGACALFILLQAAYHVVPDEVLLGYLIHHLLVLPAAVLVELFSADGVRPILNSLESDGVSLQIIRGCDGTSSMFLLMSAVLAYPAPWRTKLRGVLIGLAWLHAINVIRIVVLYFVAQADLGWFHSIHGFFAPTLIVLLVCLYFFYWLDQTREKATR